MRVFLVPSFAVSRVELSKSFIVIGERHKAFWMERLPKGLKIIYPSDTVSSGVADAS